MATLPVVLVTLAALATTPVVAALTVAVPTLVAATVALVSEPSTEHDPTSPTGESRDSGYGDADRRAMADIEAARYESAIYGGGL